MARPRKWRKVCCLPERNRFGPLNGANNQECFVTMRIDEYETPGLRKSSVQDKCILHGQRFREYIMMQGKSLLNLW